MTEVKISIRSRIEGAAHLDASRHLEVMGLMPLVRGRRVRRVAGMPLWLPEADAIFAPRRAVK